MKNACKTLALAFVLSISTNALAQVQNQPTEIITATPLSTFSDRVGSWPTDEISYEFLESDRSTFGDRLNSVPGLAVRESGSPVVSIRGSSQADRVLRLVDGVPLNMADGVGSSDLYIPSEIVGSLSLLKGPSSVFYGPYAMAGALDHRLRLFERPAVGVSLADEGGKIGNRHVSLVAPVQRDENGETSSQVSLFYERRPGEFPYSASAAGQSGTRRQNASELSRATLYSQYKIGKGQGHIFALGAKTVGETPGSLLQPFVSTFDTTATLISADFTLPHSATDKTTLRLSQTSLWGLYDRETASTSTSFSSRTSLAADYQWMIADRALNKTFVDVIGQNVTASYLGGERYYQSDLDLGDAVEIPLDIHWSLEPALRYNTRVGEVSKALSLAHTFSAQDRMWTTYSEGYRTPSLSDRFGHYGTFRGNPSLQPEHSNSIELGSSFEDGRRFNGFLEGWSLKTALFWTRYHDLIDRRSQGATETKVNVGEARALGGEFALGYGVSIWSFTLAYGYTDARNQTADEPLTLAPKHQAMALASQQLGPIVIEARATIWSSYFDRRPVTNDLVEMHGWETFDLTFRTLGLTDWELSGGILNLTNEARELTLGYPEPERRFFISGVRSF